MLFIVFWALSHARRVPKWIWHNLIAIGAWTRQYIVAICDRSVSDALAKGLRMRNRLQNTSSHRWVSHLANSSNKTLPPPARPRKLEIKSNETKLNETEDWRLKTEKRNGILGRVVAWSRSCRRAGDTFWNDARNAPKSPIDCAADQDGRALSDCVSSLSVFGCLFWMVFRFGLFAARSLSHLVIRQLLNNCSIAVAAQSDKYLQSVPL